MINNMNKYIYIVMVAVLTLVTIPILSNVARKPVNEIYSMSDVNDNIEPIEILIDDYKTGSVTQKQLETLHYIFLHATLITEVEIENVNVYTSTTAPAVDYVPYYVKPLNEDNKYEVTFNIKASTYVFSLMYYLHTDNNGDIVNYEFVSVTDTLSTNYSTNKIIFTFGNSLDFNLVDTELIPLS